MRCALIQNDVEGPLWRSTSHDCATNEARRIVCARTTDTHPVTLPLRARQCLRIAEIYDALTIDPASRFRIGRQECLDPLPARQMLALDLRFSFHHSKKKFGDTRHGQFDDFRSHVPIPWLHNLRRSRGRKSSHHKHNIFKHTLIVYRLARRRQLNAFGNRHYAASTARFTVAAPKSDEQYTGAVAGEFMSGFISKVTNGE